MEAQKGCIIPYRPERTVAVSAERRVSVVRTNVGLLPDKVFSEW